MNEREVEPVLIEWRDAQVLKHRAEQAERRALEKIAELCDGLEGKTLTLIGESLQAKIRPRENVIYERQRGAQHPLEKLSSQFPELVSMVRKSYSESGSKIKDLLLRYYEPNNGGLTKKEKTLAEKLLESRRVKSGKPTVELGNRIDANAKNH